MFGHNLLVEGVIQIPLDRAHVLERYDQNVRILPGAWRQVGSPSDGPDLRNPAQHTEEGVSRHTDLAARHALSKAEADDVVNHGAAALG